MPLYRFRLQRALAVVAIALSAVPAPAAAAAPVTKVPVVQAPAAKLKVPPIRRHPSPDRKAVLIESGDVSEGDFPQAAVYLAAGGKVYDLGWYRRVGKVRWARDSRSVTFEGAQLKDYGVDDVVRVTYELGGKTMTRQVLRQEKDEPTG